MFGKNKIELNLERLPIHTAFIIDGNGRWAKKRGLPRSAGHRAGIIAVEKIIKAALKLGLKQISFFCFSTENWNRPKEEIDTLFSLLKEYIEKDLNYYEKHNIKFMSSGNIEALPKNLVSSIKNIVEKTKNATGMIVNFCINYGGRSEILRAVNTILQQKKEQVDENEFKKYLFTAELMEPDLIIRTSGEMRISNFFLFQMAYSELYFTKTYWPDFDEKELTKALLDFQGRNRRFGSVKE